MIEYGNDIRNEYFEWIVDMMNADKHDDCISYRKLFIYLHSTQFIYVMNRDRNRADDGESLRYKFIYSNGRTNVPLYLKGPCSVLEMMVALAIKCEDIMDDPRIGDRTAQWFWEMISSLRLSGMTDDRFDRKYVEEAVDRFLYREYEPNGKGGLFTLRRPNQDLRNVEIWQQMNAYLNEIA